MTKIEWKKCWGHLRLEARKHAESQLSRFPDATVVHCPFLFPIQSPPVNCKPVLIPLGDMEYDIGYINIEGNIIYRTRSTPVGEIEIVRKS